MAKVVTILKNVMEENKEDFLYLLFAGTPFGVIYALLSRLFSLGEGF